MALSLEPVEFKRASDIHEFAVLLTQVRAQTLGGAILSLHPSDKTPLINPEQLVATKDPFDYSQERIDELTGNLFGITVQMVCATSSLIPKSWISSADIDVPLHVDPTLTTIYGRYRSSLSHHYTPYGSGIFEAARVLGSNEELKGIKRPRDRLLEIGHQMSDEFKEVKAQIPINQGDVVAFPANGQTIGYGVDQMLNPLMHRVITTSDIRAVIVR